jgi:hypothetical protein
MATVFAASESSVMVDGDAVEGVQTIDYRMRRTRASVYALGSVERVAVTSGYHDVEARLRVASSNAKLDGLAGDQLFQVVANLRHGESSMTVTFDDCYLTEKTFDLSVGRHGESVYCFTAARVREER